MHSRELRCKKGGRDSAAFEDLAFGRGSPSTTSYGSPAKMNDGIEILQLRNINSTGIRVPKDIVRGWFPANQAPDVVAVIAKYGAQGGADKS